MKATGSTRRMEGKPGRPAVGRESPQKAFVARTASPGPVLTAGPGVLFYAGALKSRCAVPRFVPAPSSFHSFFIPPERKTLWSAARRDIHEQGIALRLDDVYRLQTV